MEQRSPLNTVSLVYCLYCNDRVKGRSDKKFCNDYCRNGYHNSHSISMTPYMRKINRVLQRNRNILYQLIPLDKTEITVTRECLHATGFQPGYVTHVLDHLRTCIYVCYDFYFIEINEHDVLIKRQF